MELLTHKYLSKNYVIKSSDKASKKISLVVTDGIYEKCDESLYPLSLSYPIPLLNELEKVFYIKMDEAKIYVNNWAISINSDVDLAYYWERGAATSALIKSYFNEAGIY